MGGGGEGGDKKGMSSFWDNGPGPAGVMLPPTIGMIDHDKTKKQMPAYSLGLKLKSQLVGSGLSPGPAYGIPQGLTAKGQAWSPAYTLRMKTKLIENFNTETPGPAAYLPGINENRRKAPEVTICSRHPLKEMGFSSPGPIYLLPPAIGPVIPDKPAAAAVSLKSRATTKADMNRSPGPIYDVVPPNVYKFRAGEVSIKSKWKPLSSASYLAGPGSYDLNNVKVWRQPPSYSLGIRHSPYAGTLLTNCDKLPY